MGHEARDQTRCVRPSPTEFRVRRGSGPHFLREPAASFLLSSTGLLPPSPDAGEQGTLYRVEGRVRARGRGHRTHLKSRSRPWVWLVKRMKASMAPSPRTRVAPGSFASPQGLLTSPHGTVGLCHPEHPSLPTLVGAGALSEEQLLGLPVWGRKLWLLRQRQAAGPGERNFGFCPRVQRLLTCPRTLLYL